jgi:hypothetical protein
MTEKNLLSLLFSTPIEAGTLWKVKENVWELKLKSYKKPKKLTRWHPGLSLGSNKHSIQREETASLLHGTSDRGGPIVVKGISKENGPKYKTFFGHIIHPILLPLSKLQQSDLNSGPFGTKLDPLWYQEYDVVPNRHKPRLDKGEHQQMLNFLKRQAK